MTDMIQPIRGFRLAGVHCGIKEAPNLDLGLIVADHDVAAAGVFTRNHVRAAPVDLSAKRIDKVGKLRAVVVNSGNANACTGPQGEHDARQMTRAVADALSTRPRSVGVASTGVIGVELPIARISVAAPTLVEQAHDRGASAFSRAILTTDRGPKVARVTFRCGKRVSSVLAIAKGAGMIHPDMATTLAFVMTDADIRGKFLRGALRTAANATFNTITVDGDTSTNDSIFALASGALGGPRIDGGAPGRRFVAALTEALEAVALMIVADGEGAEHVAEIVVTGARSDRDAQAIARTVATSQLVKTAMHGCDPNWGRIMGAVGRAGVRVDPRRVRVSIGDVVVFDRGTGAMDAQSEREAGAVMALARYPIHIALAQGKGSARYWTCDLGHEYVRINADYRS